MAGWVGRAQRGGGNAYCERLDLSRPQAPETQVLEFPKIPSSCRCRNKCLCGTGLEKGGLALGLNGRDARAVVCGTATCWRHGSCLGLNVTPGGLP